MPDCDYCEDSFGDEGTYLDHLAAEHEGELGPIDRRRVEDRAGDDGMELSRVVIWGVVVVIPVVALGYALFVFGGGGGAPAPDAIDVTRTPYDVREVHYHGTMEVVIDGRRIDFSKPKYQYRNTGNDAFHFERGNGRTWHGHARGITLRYALATLGINVTEETVTFGETTYRDADPGTNVSITVNGNPVDPSEYVLRGASNPQRGDHVRIVVESR